jgi:hypothetical protein
MLDLQDYERLESRLLIAADDPACKGAALLMQDAAHAISDLCREVDALKFAASVPATEHDRDYMTRARALVGNKRKARGDFNN